MSGKNGKAWQNRIIGYGEEAPDQLLANPKNWRVHPLNQQQALSGVLRQVGIVQNIIVNQRNSTVVDGHLRVALAISEKQPSIPVTYVDLSDDEEALILATIDPLSAMAATDKQQLDALLREVGAEDAAVQQMLADLAKDAGLYLDQSKAEDPGPQIDKAEELRVKWGCELGQLWEIPSQSVRGKAHRLLCGDSTKAEDVARLMGGEKAAMMVTDPPYGIGLDTDYSQLHIGSKMVGHTVKRNRFDRVAGDDEPFDASKVQGIDGIREQFWFGADYYAQSLGDTEHGGSWLVWDKRQPSQDDGFGSGFELVWSKQRHKRILLRHEWFGFLSGGNKEATNRMHPTQKPSALYGEIMERWGQRSDIVFDAYVGSGPALVAAEQTGRICYGMEIEPKYIGVCLERMAGMGLEPRLLGATPTAALQEVS